MSGIRHSVRLALCDNNGVKRDPEVGRAEGDTMGDLLQPWHLLMLAIMVFVLFGAKRLPELGKGLGEGLKGFREGIKGVNDPAPSPTQQRHR